MRIKNQSVVLHDNFDLFMRVQFINIRFANLVGRRLQHPVVVGTVLAMVWRRPHRFEIKPITECCYINVWSRCSAGRRCFVRLVSDAAGGCTTVATVNLINGQASKSKMHLSSPQRSLDEWRGRWGNFPSGRFVYIVDNSKRKC